MSSGIDLAAALAGQVNRDLKEVPNHKPINPHEFLQKAGVPMNRPNPVPARNYPGMIDAPKSTPMGSEILETTADMPALIPMPEDLKKFVADVPEISAEVPQANIGVPAAEVLPVSAPPSGKMINLQDAILDIQQRVTRIEKLLESSVKPTKYKKPFKNSYQRIKAKKLLNESNTSSVSGSNYTETTTPGDAPQTT